MSDEYLWDRSGEPDPLVAELEGKLSSLAFEPVFVVDEARTVDAPRKSSWRPYFIGSAVTAAAVACSVMLYWCGYRVGVDAPPIEPASQPVIVGAPQGVDEESEPESPPPSREAPEVPVDADVQADVEPEPPRVADARDSIGSFKAKSKGKTKASSSAGLRDPLEGAPSTSSSSTAKGSGLDVDCILDPKACGKTASSSSKPTADPSLPEKLSTTDIRDGVNPVKGAAKACGTAHGAKPGEKVKIKLSIAGATGAVTSATAEAPHTGTPLGNCVAAALKRARFKRFQKASLGAVYPVSM